MIGAAARGRKSRPVVVTRRLRGVSDFIIALGVWAGLVATAAGSYGLYIERAYVAEALSHAIAIKEELGAQFAESGRWPSDAHFSLLRGENPKRPSPTVEFQEGAFTFVLGTGPIHRVSFRAAVSTTSPRAPVIWLCGYATAPAGHHVAAPNQTDIPLLYLPAACRG